MTDSENSSLKEFLGFESSSSSNSEHGKIGLKVSKSFDHIPIIKKIGQTIVIKDSIERANSIAKLYA